MAEYMQIKSLDEFDRLTDRWFQRRGFFDHMLPECMMDEKGPRIGNQIIKGQMIKLGEEFGELCGNVARGKRDGIKDDIGDMMVVLVGLAGLHDLTLSECAEHAYNDIKDRKGKMIDGVFVKEADLVAMGCDEEDNQVA